MNFARNIGGSILISLTNAFVTESAAIPQSTFLAHLQPTNAAFQQRLNRLSGALTGHLGPGNAGGGAQGQIYTLVQQQTQTQAYVDVYFTLAALSAIMVLLSFLLDRNQPGEGSQEIAVH